jgi:gluconokinase
MIVVLMGVTGSGKSTVGHALVAKTGWEFAEGDDFHSPENVAKMHAGIPLTDEDRAPWLASLHKQIMEWEKRGVNAVLTCSALKQKYRDTLNAGVPEGHLKFVVLEASKEMLARRLSLRQGHYMNPKLLDSQLDTLEDPKDALHVSVENSPDDAVARIMACLPEEPA